MRHGFWRFAVLAGLCLAGQGRAACPVADVEGAYYHQDIEALGRIIDGALAGPALDLAGAERLGLAGYRQGTLLARAQRKGDAETLLDQVIDKIKPAQAAGQDRDLAALMSMLYGLEIGLSSIRGFFLGDKIRDQLEPAENAGEPTPLLHLAEGLSRLYRPRLFGGGASNAIPELDAAVAGFDRLAAHGQPACWGRSDAVLALARAKIKLDERPAAITLIEDVIARDAQNPTAHWMLDQLKSTEAGQ